MKKFMSYLGAVFILAACLSGAACSHTPLTQLPTPQDFEFDLVERTVIWGEVPNASGYVVSFDGTEKETAEPRFALPEGSSYGNYRIGVIALGDHKDYDNSKWANYLFSFEEPPAHDYDEVGWEYTLREDGRSYEIAPGKIDVLGDLEIPSKFKGLPVTKVADRAFYVKGKINIATTGVTIPDTVTEIGIQSFISLTQIREITIPNSVQTIGRSAFFDCVNLKHVTLPENLKVIPQSCFQDCGLEEITFPSGLEEIGERAFRSGLEELSVGVPENKFTKIDIPDSVKRIGYSAFSNCRRLKDFELPSSLEWMGSDAFYNTAWWNAQPDGFILFDDILYAYKGDVPEGTKLIVPSNVKQIVDELFFSQSGLTEIYIPDGVTLGECLFTYCDRLEQVRLPSDLTELPRLTFNHCESLKHIDIPSGVTEIGESAFEYCLALEEITLPKGLRSLGDLAFEGSALKEIVLPSSLEYLGASPFRHCENLASIFYEGTETAWMKLKAQNNEDVQHDWLYSNATLYYLSEDRPQGTGNYWHYVNGVPTVWS